MEMLNRIFPTAWVRELLFCLVTSTLGLSASAAAAAAVSTWP